MIPLFTADPEDAVSALKENGYKTVCAGIRNSVSAFDADLKKSLFLIVGGERRGISANFSLSPIKSSDSITAGLLTVLFRRHRQPRYSDMRYFGKTGSKISKD